MLTLDKIQDNLVPLGNPEQAVKMEKYMRNQFPFLGIKTPERRKAIQSLIKSEGFPDLNSLKGLLYNLWELPQREYQNVALDLLGRVKNYPADYIDMIETFIVTKSWWDTVDALATQNAGTYFHQHPEKILPITERWINSDHMWLNRSAILFQLSYKNETDFELLKQYIQLQAASKEFFLQKAIGWALREYSKTSPKEVQQFIQENVLAPLSKREGSKVINKH